MINVLIKIVNNRFAHKVKMFLDETKLSKMNERDDFFSIHIQGRNIDPNTKRSKGKNNFRPVMQKQTYLTLMNTKSSWLRRKKIRVEKIPIYVQMGTR